MTSRTSLLLLAMASHGCSLTLDIDGLHDGCEPERWKRDGICVGAEVAPDGGNSACMAGDAGPCESAAGCKSDEYESAPGVCDKLRTCPPGTHVVRDSQAQDRRCVPCPSDTFTSTENELECHDVTACPEGMIEVEGPTMVSARKCDHCSAGEFEQDGVCVPARECPAGTYIGMVESGSTDRTCSVCPKDTFSDGPNAEQCEGWQVCPSEKPESVAGDAWRDRVCSACGAGRFGTADNCADLTVCQPGTYEHEGPTGETNRRCMACDGDTFSATTNALACTPRDVCGDNEFMPAEPSAGQDRHCQPCQGLKVSEGPNANECHVDFEVHAGMRNTCVLRRSTQGVTCWGSHFATYSPSGRFSQIDVAKTENQSGGCGILADSGEPSCWGAAPFAAPGAAPRERLSSVSVGKGHACGIRETGSTLVCWGDYRARFGDAEPPAGAFSYVAAGASSNCAIRTTGEVHCWGEYDSWTAGQYTLTPDERFSSVDVGLDFICGVTLDQQARCWGALGVDGKYNPPDTAFESVSVGFKHACGVTAAGAVRCWGEDGLGDETNEEGAGRVASQDQYHDRFASVDAGPFHNCAVHAHSGGIFCWGTPGKDPPEEFAEP
jgi:hypothetical protein